MREMLLKKERGEEEKSEKQRKREGIERTEKKMERKNDGGEG